MTSACSKPQTCCLFKWSDSLNGFIFIMIKVILTSVWFFFFIGPSKNQKIYIYFNRIWKHIPLWIVKFQCPKCSTNIEDIFKRQEGIDSMIDKHICALLLYIQVSLLFVADNIVKSSFLTSHFPKWVFERTSIKIFSSKSA